jgi:ankyrin repeat protein
MSLIGVVTFNNLEEVKRLIDKGVNVNETDQFQRTALWYAASLGFEACVAALLDAKADVNKSDEDGKSPLYQASAHDFAKCVQLLLQGNADPNLRTHNGYSALLEASIYEHVTCIELLVALGANIEIDSEAIATPLGFAISYNAQKSAVHLLYLGAKLSNLPLWLSIPHYLERPISNRKHAVGAIIALKVALKKKKLAKDMVHLLALFVWRNRCNDKWSCCCCSL